MLSWLRRKTEDLFGAGRSGRWASARREHLSREPACVSCGRKKDLEVHHVEPFHESPELELEPSNLVTVCRDCHFVVAHGCDWKSWRPEVRRLARILKDAELRS